MDNKNIQSVLQDALEEEIPSSEIDLWSGVKERLVAGKHPLIQQGETMNLSQSRHIQRVTFTILVILAWMAVALITPQGRAFAQSILQFFVRSDRDEYPLQPWQMTPPAQTSTDSPFVLSVQEAEVLAGYDVRSPVKVPFSMVFVGASYDEKYHVVSQAFGQNAEYIELSLWQQPLEYYQPCGDISQPCDSMLGANLVGAGAYLETVQVGNQTGEYVEGVWELTNDGPIWNPTPYSKCLRWKMDTMIYELVYNGIDLSRDDLVALAAGIR